MRNDHLLLVTMNFVDMLSCDHVLQYFSIPLLLIEESKSNKLTDGMGRIKCYQVKLNFLTIHSYSDVDHEVNIFSIIYAYVMSQV